MANKGLGALIAEKAGRVKDSELEFEQEVDEGADLKLDAASELISAINEGDAQTVLDALEALMSYLGE